MVPGERSTHLILTEVETRALVEDLQYMALWKVSKSYGLHYGVLCTGKDIVQVELPSLRNVQNKQACLPAVGM